MATTNEKIKAFQLAWNEKADPKNKLVVDGLAGGKTASALKESGYDSVDSWWSDWDFNKRYNTLEKPILAGQESPLNTKSRHSAAYQAYLAGQEAYKKQDELMKNKAQIQEDIKKRMAGLPHNVTTWSYTDEPENDVNGIHFKTDKGYYTLEQPAVSKRQSEPDWDYRTALIYRIFGDETPMQQYITKKNAERISRDNAMYNQYLHLQNKEEADAKEREQEAEKEALKNVEKENAKSAFRKSRSDIATAYSSLENELEELKNKGYLSEEEYRKQREELTAEKPRRQAYDKYSQYTSFANESEKSKVLNDIKNDSDLNDDDKISLTNKLKSITSETSKARQSANAGAVGKATEKTNSINDIVNNKTPLSMLSKEQRTMMLNSGYGYTKDKGWYKR